MAPLLPKVIVSAFFSVIYGGLSYFLFMDLHDAWRWALICGLAAFSLLMLMMLLQDERRARRYARAEKQLPARRISGWAPTSAKAARLPASMCTCATTRSS